jgi:hypothetical protein
MSYFSILLLAAVVQLINIFAVIPNHPGSLAL